MRIRENHHDEELLICDILLVETKYGSFMLVMGLSKILIGKFVTISLNMNLAK